MVINWYRERSWRNEIVWKEYCKEHSAKLRVDIGFKIKIVYSQSRDYLIEVTITVITSVIKFEILRKAGKYHVYINVLHADIIKLV